MKILKSEFEKLKQEIDEMHVGAFWLETYAIGLKERCRRLKEQVDQLEKGQNVEAQT